MTRCAVSLALLLSVSPGLGQQDHPGLQSRPIIVASKPFGESYLLAEMFAQLLEARGLAESYGGATFHPTLAARRIGRRN